MLPSDYKGRKEFPLATFLTAYFPDTIEALVALSIQGNIQHDIDPNAVNPFKLPTDRIMWDRSKSMEQCETAMRHLWDHMRALRSGGTLPLHDTDGVLHITKATWRCGAETQLTIEAARECQHGADAQGNITPENREQERAAMASVYAAEGFPSSPDSPDINGNLPTDPMPLLLDDVGDLTDPAPPPEAPAPDHEQRWAGRGLRGYMGPHGWVEPKAPEDTLHVDLPPA